MTVMGKDSDGQRHWLIEWISHHWYAYWLGAYVLSLATNVLPDSGWWTAATLVVFVLWLVIYHRVMYIHRFGLCLRCIQLAPLDPEVKVKRYDNALKFTHRLADVKSTLAWGILGWLTWMSLCTNVFKLFLEPKGLMYQIIGIPVIWWPLLYMERSTRIHNWLHPWCPYCRWDNGGEHEEVPDPVPSGTVDQDVTA